MKKWTKEETTALIASVAENGYSKGIRRFMDSADNVNGRTFAACEYMIHKQSHQSRQTENLGDAVVSIVTEFAKVQEKQEKKNDKKKMSLWRRFVKWFFAM